MQTPLIMLIVCTGPFLSTFLLYIMHSFTVNGMMMIITNFIIKVFPMQQTIPLSIQNLCSVVLELKVHFYVLSNLYFDE